MANQLKYYNIGVVFQEIPDETTLSVNITNCPCHCPGCHSSYLWNDVGVSLDMSAIDSFADRFGKGITCISFMGGDANPEAVVELAQYVRKVYPHYKVAWWSGRQYVPSSVDRQVFDYIKVGPYLSHLGNLESPQTNQRLMKRQVDGTFVDITYRFWNKANPPATV